MEYFWKNANKKKISGDGRRLDASSSDHPSDRKRGEREGGKERTRDNGESTDRQAYELDK